MKRMIKMAVTLLVFGFMLYMAVNPVWTEEPVTEAPLKFEIVFDKTTFNADEHVLCKMILTNISKEPIRVNERFLVNFESPSPHEVYFVIKNAKGIQLPFQLRIRAGEPKLEDFTTLNPGESIEKPNFMGFFDIKGYDLTEAYGLKEPGLYTIFAVYSNRAQAEGMKAWTGNLKSNTVKITIKK
ncbi:MAG: hypothetical protein ABIH00_00660 [Armatimonadota bacterium]